MFNKIYVLNKIVEFNLHEMEQIWVKLIEFTGLSNMFEKKIRNLFDFVQALRPVNLRAFV